jgi:phage shock protein A
MRLLERISGLMSTDIDHLLEQVEDPELAITQVISDMEGSIVDLRRETVSAVARESRLRKKLFAAEEASRGVELQATLALQRGDDLGARQIVGRKIGVLKSRDALEEEMAEARDESARLVAGLLRMEDRAQLARRKRDALARRRRNAEADGGWLHSHPRAGTGVFDPYAEAVSALQREAEAAREPRSERGPAGNGGIVRLARHRELEGGGEC